MYGFYITNKGTDKITDAQKHFSWIYGFFKMIKDIFLFEAWNFRVAKSSYANDAALRVTNIEIVLSSYQGIL